VSDGWLNTDEAAKWKERSKELAGDFAMHYRGWVWELMQREETPGYLECTHKCNWGMQWVQPFMRWP
jgi:hypothetical protein